MCNKVVRQNRDTEIPVSFINRSFCGKRVRISSIGQGFALTEDKEKKITDDTFVV